LFFIIENQLDVGDLVEINGFTGTVEEVGLRATKLKNWLGEVKFLPNGSIIDITNYSLVNPTIYIDIPITYEEDIDKVEKVLKKLALNLKKEIKGIIGNIEVLGVENFSETSVDIRVTVECKKGEQFDVKRKLLKEIKQKFDEEKIIIPYQQILISGACDGKPKV
jgi:small conductance mechanosensitive channel